MAWIIKITLLHETITHCKPFWQPFLRNRFLIYPCWKMTPWAVLLSIYYQLYQERYFYLFCCPLFYDWNPMQTSSWFKSTHLTTGLTSCFSVISPFFSLLCIVLEVGGIPFACILHLINYLHLLQIPVISHVSFPSFFFHPLGRQFPISMYRTTYVL